MKNIFIYTLIGLFAQQFTFAQEVENPPAEEKKVYGEILDNNTSNFKVFRVLVPLYAFTASSTNSSIYNIEGGLFADIGNWGFEAEYSYKLLDKLFPDANDENRYARNEIVFSKFKSSPANYIRGNATYYFNPVTKTKKYHFVLKKKREILYQTYVPGEITVRKGLKLGFEKGVTWMGLSNARISGQNLTTPSLGVQEFQYLDQSTTMKYSTLIIGYTVAKTYNMRMDFEGFQRESSSYYTFWSFDLLLNVQSKLDDVYATIPGTFNGSNGATTYIVNDFNINDHTKKLPIGFRVSYRLMPLQGVVTYGLEAGYAPGVMSKLNLFAGFKLQLALGNRVLEKYGKKAIEK